jgi:DNA polymerase-3 subunit epsilon
MSITGPLSPFDPRPLLGAPVAVLDFESTGVNPDIDRACSVAVVLIPALGQSEPVPLLYTLLDPEQHIPDGASQIHGIYDADVVGAPTFAEVCDVIGYAISDSLLCAYNLPYDYTMLEAEMKRAGSDIPLPFGFIDPCILARHIFRYTEPRKKDLGTLAKHYGVTFEAHNALSDAMTTAIILPKLLHDGGHGVKGDPREQRPIPRDALMSVEAFYTWQAPIAVEREENFLDMLRRFRNDVGPNRWLNLARRNW